MHILNPSKYSIDDMVGIHTLTTSLYLMARIVEWPKNWIFLFIKNGQK